jgi:radical SAM superfamily enzyme YgiQ (UPF0313 family)
MEKLKILLFGSIDERSEVETRYSPVGLAGLAAVVKKAFPTGAQVRIGTRNLQRHLHEFAPDIVGFGCVSQNYDIAKNHAQLCRAAGARVMLGGVHISMLPQSLSNDFDVACLGEGEETIKALVELFMDKHAFPADKLNNIPGIAFHQGDEIVITPPRPLIADLDSIPIPCYELLDVSAHRYLFTSRGCPYRCVFCASSRFWNKVRFHSPDRIIEEIEVLSGLGARMVSFYDDLFTADTRRLEEIAARIAGSPLLRRMKFTCSLRANTVTEQTASLLKQMNVVSCGLGLESGNQEILTYLKGGGIRVEDNKRAVSILKKQGIKANASFVIGSPQETAAQMMDTYRFIRTVPVDLVDIYVLTPFPGTPVWEWAEKRELVGDNMEWAKLNINFETQPEKIVILNQMISREELIRIYKKFRRLRLRKNLKAVWSHPMLRDLPGIAWRTMKERWARSLQRRSIKRIAE